MSTLIHERVEQARAGINPTVIARLESGWAVLGDQQHPPGYTLLLADPVVASLNDLAEPERSRFMRDMSLLGDALLQVTQADRINYGIYGNTDPALHAHIWPRYPWEAAEFRSKPVWFYPGEERHRHPFSVDKHGELLLKIRMALGARVHGEDRLPD